VHKLKAVGYRQLEILRNLDEEAAQNLVAAQTALQNPRVDPERPSDVYQPQADLPKNFASR
jgi:hypothetical protein